VQLLLLVLTEQQVQAAVAALGGSAPVSGFRWVWVVLAPLPWLAGAALLLADRAYVGTAVVVAAAVLGTVAGLVPLAELLGGDRVLGEGAAAGLLVVGQPVVVLLGLLAAAAALWSRPRGSWRSAAPGPIGVYVAVAVTGWLPTAFQTLELAPPGAMRSFARTELSRLDGVDALASVSLAVVVAVLLVVAPRLRPDVAGALVLVVAVPQLASALGDVLQVRVTEDLILTPPWVLGTAGLVGLVLVATRWLATAPRSLAAASGAPSAPGGDEPR
jgi:hypothetical protein